MQDPALDSRRFQPCPSCSKPMRISSEKCRSCGWQPWFVTQQFLWLCIAVAIGVAFVWGASHQDKGYTSPEQAQRDRQYEVVSERRRR